MKISVLVLALFSITMSAWTIVRSNQHMARLNQSPAVIKLNKETRIDNQMRELKKLQKETSDKVATCWKDKSCYGDKAVHQLLFELRLKSTMIEALYVDQCPEFKVSINDYTDRIVTLEAFNRRVSAKQFNEMNVPQYLEYITREIVDISFEACKSEYATRW